MVALLDRVKAFLHPPIPEPARVPPVEMRDAQLAIQQTIRASYDSVARTPENVRHWSWADNLAADASLNPGVRIALRSQSRYELHENNSYGYGFVETLVTDTIGTGPRLQVTQFDRGTNARLEQAWNEWSMAIDLCDDLELVRSSKIVDGEVVIRFINNLRVEDVVSLDLQVVECDQLRSPRFEMEIAEDYVDGVRLDRFGNPFAYDILRHHPGSRYWTPTDYFAHDTYPYDQIIHAYKKRRPGQHRGVPEFAPALPLFAFLRRFTLATVSAAETAASVSQVVESDNPIPEELESEYAAATFEKFLDTIPIDRNSATVLPNMWKLKQFAAEHPTTTYAMFKRELISEISRCLCIPANIATGDSSGSNMASARFDWRPYERRIKREQKYFNRKILDRIFSEWLIEAALVGAIPQRAANFITRQLEVVGRSAIANRIRHDWHWDGLRDQDDGDAADAQRTRLQNGATHRAREYAEQGLDIETEDIVAAESFGVTLDEYRQLVRTSIFANGNFVPGEGEGTDDSSVDEAQSAEESGSQEPQETEETEEAL